MHASTSQTTLSGQLLELVNDIVWTATPDGHLIYTNPATERVYGRPVTEFYHNPTLWLEMVHPADRELARGSAALVLAHGQTETTYRIIRPDGSIRWLLDRKHVLYNQAGQPEHIGGITTDITAQKEAEAELSHSQQLLAAFFSQALDGFFFMMLDEPVVWNDQVDQEAVLDYVFAYQRVTRVNPAMIEQYRTTEAEFIGKTPRDFFAHDLAQGRAAWRRLLDQGRLHLETKERRFDGTPMYVEGDYVCLYDAAGRITGHFGIQRDVTERKRAEAALQIQHTVAVALNEYRDLNQALAQILETVCQLESIDSGGVYLPDPASGALELAVQRGLSPEFLKEVAYFGPDAPQSRLVRAGRVIYGHYEQIRPVTNGVHHQEGLHAVAILPVMHQGELLAVLNLASHTHADIPADVRTTLETLALQIGSALARLRFEAALAESRQNLQTLFDTINDFLFVLDQEGHICQTNPVVWQRLGYNSQELLSQPVLVVHSPDRHAEAAEIMAAILAGERDHCSLPLQTRTGALIPVETRVTKGTWSGRPALFGLARDITVRQRVEETLRQSEERFRLLLDSAPDAIFIAKIGTGIIIEANTAAARLLAKPKPEIIGMHFSELHPPEMATESRQMFTTHVFESDTMGEGLPVEYVALRADGQRVPVEVAARVIELQGEKLLMGIFRDITDRKRIEAWLLASERKFRSFIEQSPDAVVLADGTGQVIEWNEAAEQLFGQTKTDVLGQAVWEVQFSFGLPAMQTPDRYEQLKAAFLTVLQTGQGPLLNRLSEVGIQRPDGSQRVIQTIAFSIESGQDFLLGSISRDVTEQKQAEAERERLIVELQESLAQVKQLSGLLPICASCKKIRDDAGYWQDVAVYIRDHSEVEFSHGFCPECMEKLYPEYFKKRKD